MEEIVTDVFVSIVDGEMVSRGTDAFGSGQPGAGRGGRTHLGIDVIAEPNQRIRSPLSGDVVREALPYANDPTLRGVFIRGTGNYVGWEVKMFYVAGLLSGAVTAGQLVGHAQSLQDRYPGIINHVHLEVYKDGVEVDPREPFRQCF